MALGVGALPACAPPARQFPDPGPPPGRRPGCPPARASPSFDLCLPTVTVSSLSSLARGGSPADDGPSTSGRAPTGEAAFIEFPARAPAEQGSRPQPPLVRVRLSVHYRVHSRQMLCIGGSQIPFGWSFLSIAKVPMAWNPGDVWTAEVELPVGTRIEYKYVILEEQDWTQQVSEDAEGVVTFTYRTQPEGPPDVQQIQKQMAIVAWQPGPNRYVQVPSQEELDSLRPGEVREREPARGPVPAAKGGAGRAYGQQALGGFPGGLGEAGLPLLARVTASMRSQQGKGRRPGEGEVDELEGTWEKLGLEEGQPLLERRDVWGLPRENRGIQYGERRDLPPGPPSQP